MKNGQNSKLRMSPYGMHKDADDDGNWITVNGTHIEVNGEGEVTKGPTGLKSSFSTKKSSSAASGKSSSTSGSNPSNASTGSTSASSASGNGGGSVEAGDAFFKALDVTADVGANTSENEKKYLNDLQELVNKYKDDDSHLQMGSGATELSKFEKKVEKDNSLTDKEKDAIYKKCIEARFEQSYSDFKAGEDAYEASQKKIGAKENAKKSVITHLSNIKSMTDSTGYYKPKITKAQKFYKQIKSDPNITNKVKVRLISQLNNAYAKTHNGAGAIPTSDYQDLIDNQ